MEVAEQLTQLCHGDHAGGYTIRGFLGQGGFGITYLAHDDMLDRPVAIKEFMPRDLAYRDRLGVVRPLQPECAASYAYGLQNFIREARTLARFRHRHIVQVLQVFESSGTAYMVMDYEKGHDLESLIKKGHRFSEDTLKNMMAPVIDGLRQVHRQGFVHRDIKPENIMLRSSDGSPVLLDFGSARQALTPEHRSLTVMVSAGYAPLEQYSGIQEQGPWSDIYALGATLYCAVTGQAPVDSTLRGAAWVNNGRDPHQPLSQMAHRDYSAEFCRAIDWALEFRIDDRPQSLNQWCSRLLGDRGYEEPTMPALSLPDCFSADTLVATPSANHTAHNRERSESVTVMSDALTLHHHGSRLWMDSYRRCWRALRIHNKTVAGAAAFVCVIGVMVALMPERSARLENGVAEVVSYDQSVPISDQRAMYHHHSSQAHQNDAALTARNTSAVASQPLVMGRQGNTGNAVLPEPASVATVRSDTSIATPNAIPSGNTLLKPVRKPQVSDMDIQQVLSQFYSLTRAIERADSQRMRELTVWSPDIYAYFEFVFGRYQESHVRISEIQVSQAEQKVSGVLETQALILQDGTLRRPPEHLRLIPIHVVREADWSKIVW